MTGCAPQSLGRWVATAARLLRPGGTLTVIFRADGVADLLNALGGDFGAITLLPVHGKPDTSAIRVVAGAIKGGRAPPAILPGLVLAAHDDTPTPAAAAVLRHGAALTLVRRGPVSAESKARSACSVLRLGNSRGPSTITQYIAAIITSLIVIAIPDSPPTWSRHGPPSNPRFGTCSANVKIA